MEHYLLFIVLKVQMVEITYMTVRCGGTVLYVTVLLLCFENLFCKCTHIPLSPLESPQRDGCLHKYDVFC